MFLYAAQARGNLPPTLRQMRDHMGVRGIGGIHAMLEQLADDGFIRRDYRRARGLVVLWAPGLEALTPFDAAFCADHIDLIRQMPAYQDAEAEQRRAATALRRWADGGS